MTTVGVVVPVLNSARTLRSRVESLRTRTHRCEVVVVDDHLLDSTLCTAGPLADLVIGAGLERSAQRNCGAAPQNADPVALADSGMTLAPQVVAKAVAAVESGVASMVVGHRTVRVGYWTAAGSLSASSKLVMACPSS